MRCILYRILRQEPKPEAERVARRRARAAPRLAEACRTRVAAPAQHRDPESHDRARGSRAARGVGLLAIPAWPAAVPQGWTRPHRPNFEMTPMNVAIRAPYRHVSGRVGIRVKAGADAQRS